MLTYNDNNKIVKLMRIIEHGLSPIGDTFMGIQQETGILLLTGCLAVVVHGIINAAHTTADVGASAAGTAANLDLSVFDCVFENPTLEYKQIDFVPAFEPAREIIFKGTCIKAGTLVVPHLYPKITPFLESPHLVIIHDNTQMVSLMNFNPGLAIHDMARLTPSEEHSRIRFLMRNFIESYNIFLNENNAESASLRLTVVTSPAHVQGAPFGLMQEPLIPLKDILTQIKWSLAAGVQEVPHLYTYIENVNQNYGTLRAAIDLVILECENLAEAMNVDAEREMWNQEPGFRSYNQLKATYQLLRYLEMLYSIYDPSYERWPTLHDL